MALKLSVLFDGKNAKLKQATRESQSELERLKTSALQVTSVIASAYGAATSARALLENAKMIDRWNAQMRVAAGGTQEARMKMSELNEMADETGTRIEELILGFTRLSNLGLDPSEDALLSYMNTSRAMGKSLEQFIEAVADASVAEFERLKEFGIKARNEGETIKFTFQGVTTEVLNNADAIQKYLRRLGDEKFSDMVTLMADTVEGATARMSNQWIKTLKSINENGVGRAMKESIDAGAEALGVFTTFIEENGEEIIDVGQAIAAIFAAKIVGGVGVATRAFALHQVSQARVIARYAAMNNISLITTSRMIALNGATRLASRSMALLGGPVGVIALAAYALYEFTSEAETAEERTARLTEKTKQLTESYLGLGKGEIQKEFAEMTQEMGALSAELALAMQEEKEARDKRDAAVLEAISTAKDEQDAAIAAIARTKQLTAAQIELQTKLDAAEAALQTFAATEGEVADATGRIGDGTDDLTSSFDKVIDKLAEQIIQLEMTEEGWERYQILQAAGTNLTETQIDTIDRLIAKFRELKAETNFDDVIEDINEMTRTAGMTDEQRERYRFEKRAGYENLNPEQRMEFDRSWEQYQQAEDRNQNVVLFQSMEQELSSEGMSPIDKLKAEREQRLEILKIYGEQESLLEEEIEAKKLEIQAEYNRKREALDNAQLINSLMAGQQLFDGLAGMAKSFAGEQSGIYKAMFAVSKAFSIAQSIVAIQTGIAQAAALPFPANLGAMATVAAQTASIISTIQGTQFQGQAHDGIGRVPAANEGTWLLKKDEMVLNPVQRENFEFLVDHIKRQKATQSNGQPSIEVKVVHSPVINMQGGGDNARADVEGALDAANERLKADLIDDFSSGGPIYQTLKSRG